MTGLAYHLGFSSRTSLLNYEAKPQYMSTIARARMRAESYAESRLFDRDGARGAEFSLRCNYGWRDKDDSEKPKEKPEPIRIEFVNGDNRNDENS